MATIDLHRYPEHAFVRLNRPSKRNALSLELIQELRDCLIILAREPSIRAVILTGNGPSFCSGADINELLALVDAEASEIESHSKAFQALFEEIRNHPKPIISAVNGPAIGGGCGLALACDFTIAAESAVLGFAEVTIGFVPAFVSVYLSRLCGEKRTRDLLLTGRLISATDALAFGIISRVVSRNQLLTEATRLALEVSANSAQAVELTKKLINDLPGLDWEHSLRLAAHANAFARTTEDFREGIRAFLEKRRPAWRESGK